MCWRWNANQSNLTYRGTSLQNAFLEEHLEEKKKQQKQLSGTLMSQRDLLSFIAPVSHDLSRLNEATVIEVVILVKVNQC